MLKSRNGDQMYSKDNIDSSIYLLVKLTKTQDTLKLWTQERGKGEGKKSINYSSKGDSRSAPSSGNIMQATNVTYKFLVVIVKTKTKTKST